MLTESHLRNGPKALSQRVYRARQDGAALDEESCGFCTDGFEPLSLDEVVEFVERNGLPCLARSLIA